MAPNHFISLIHIIQCSSQRRQAVLYARKLIKPRPYSLALVDELWYDMWAPAATCLWEKREHNDSLSLYSKKKPCKNNWNLCFCCTWLKSDVAVELHHNLWPRYFSSALTKAVSHTVLWENVDWEATDGLLLQKTKSFIKVTTTCADRPGLSCSVYLRSICINYGR